MSFFQGPIKMRRIDDGGWRKEKYASQNEKSHKNHGDNAKNEIKE
jgi:hypothetical protein